LRSFAHAIHRHGVDAAIGRAADLAVILLKSKVRQGPSLDTAVF